MQKEPNITEALFITTRADAQQYQDTLVQHFFKSLIGNSGLDADEKKDAERVFLLWEMLGRVGSDN